MSMNAHTTGMQAGGTSHTVSNESDPQDFAAVHAWDPSSTSWLIWKESKQLLPLCVLMATVAVLALLMHVLGGALLSSKFLVPDQLMLLAFPGLFAAGAGPMLVGQERAQRTLDWLILLPVSVSKLLSVKLFVSMIALTGGWLLVAFLIAVFGLANPQTLHWVPGLASTSNSPIYPIWIAHSGFMLIAGFYIAWRIKNHFYALIALIAIACVPWMLASVTLSMSVKVISPHSLPNWLIGYCLLGIAAFVPLTYWAAVRHVLPAAAPRIKPLVSPTRRVGAGVSSSAPQFGTQLFPLVWQSISGSARTWFALVVMLVASFLCLLVSNQGRVLDGLYDVLFGTLNIGILMFGLSVLACSWLGVMVFKHDGSTERIRFLADRGVSPAKVYVARHVVPVAILSTGLLAYGAWTLQNLSERLQSNPALSLAAFALFALTLYSVSQWISQLIRALILSMILAPILSIIVLAWLGFSYTQLGFPIAGLVVAAVVPLIATRCMMRRYMDSTERPTTFWMAGAVMALLLFLPIGHAIRLVVQAPSMTKNQRSALLEEGALAYAAAPPAMQLILSWTESSEDSAPIALDTHADKAIFSIENYREDPFEWLGQLKQLEADPTQAAMFGKDEVDVWRGRFTRSKLTWMHSEDPEGFEAFARWIDSASVMLPAFRRSLRIEDQRNADQIEFTLIELMGQKRFAEQMNHPSVKKAISILGNAESRAAARRRALLASWHGVVSRRKMNRIVLPVLETVPPGLLPWIGDRYHEAFVLVALEGIESSRKPNAEQNWRRKLHELYHPYADFEPGPHGSRFSHKDQVGELWGGDWESFKAETDQ